MKDLELVEINNNSYVVLKEVKHKDTSYLYLSNINDEEDIMIRKTEGDMIIPLASEEEFEIACNLLIKQGLI
ncbi:MAG: hypothetical protein IJG97_03435 [Bacilli bacterium]|nr:hypothetical protein [Bacilli bacterium]